MARKGENIYLRKDGRWEGRYIKGRKKSGKPLFGSIYGKTYSEVKKRLIIIKSKLYQEKGCELVYYQSKTLQDWMEYWLEICIRPNIKASTYQGYLRSIEKHILPLLGQQEIRELTARDIQMVANALSEQLAPGTLHGVFRLLKAALLAAQKQGLVSQNPYTNIKLPKLKSKRPRILTLQEQEKLVRFSLLQGDYAYMFCLYTGLRVGELAALRWEDIDFENNMLYVKHSVMRIPLENRKRGKSGLIITTPKSESSIREIPLPLFLIKLLYEEKEKRANDNGFVFHGKKGVCLDPRTMQKRLEKICKQSNLKGVHMHTLRHTFATRCLENGVRYEILSELLGHASVQITLNYYVHCTLQDKRAIIDSLHKAA